MKFKNQVIFRKYILKRDNQLIISSEKSKRIRLKRGSTVSLMIIKRGKTRLRISTVTLFVLSHKEKLPYVRKYTRIKTEGGWLYIDTTNVMSSEEVHNIITAPLDYNDRNEIITLKDK